MKRNSRVVLMIAFAILVLSPLGAWATFTPPTADFCTLFGNLITNPVVGYLPADFAGLLALFKPPLADINGTSLIDTKPSLHPQDYPIDQYPQAWTWDTTLTPPQWVLLSTVIDIHGNGMRDCGAELGVVYKLLMANPPIDDTATGGVSSQMVIDAWSHNWDTLGTCIGNYWTLIGSLAPELRFILVGYLCIGDGSFTADPPIPPETSSTVYHITGGAGFIAGLLTILNNSGLLGVPALADLSNYTLLPQYLASTGNASGRNNPPCTNQEMYNVKDNVTLPSPLPDPLPATLLTSIANGDAAYVTSALDPAQNCVPAPCTPDQLLIDTDHDDLPDCMEAQYNTDPNNPDTDGGGVFDGVEVALHMNPLDPSDDHLVPATNYVGLALLGLLIGVAGVVTVARIRKSRASA